MTPETLSISRPCTAANVIRDAPIEEMVRSSLGSRQMDEPRRVED